MTEALSRLPKMDRVLDAAALATTPWRREVVRRVAEGMLAALRDAIRRGAGAPTVVPDAEQFAVQVAARLEALCGPHPRAVINATGVLLHTNLGRAPWSDAAIAAATTAARACDLEVELDSGQRGSRFAWTRPLLAAVIGAPDVHVVNNNAAGLLLACTVLGSPGGVALSRGQMVEIGDGFRVATMAAAGGCRIVAVGSTNRTHAADYEAALAPGPDGSASAILWVHLSNFEQHGYVAEVALPELAAIARAHGVPLVADLGSGSLGTGLPAREPTIASYLEHGADVVLASGDKLLGGPQAGIVAGTREVVERMRRHPMARALRPDKVTLAALHATAASHAGREPPPLPLHRMVAWTLDELRTRAAAVADALGLEADAVQACDATIGGGSLPGDRMPSIAVRLPAGGRASALARRLRTGEIAVVGRIEDEAVWLDLRTVDPRDDARLVAAARTALR
ncbi:MAG: L-seryl-tRNA(Sec) selenium transferase [Deltaproteobacteria bacterium]|nr:L-seryl-tRNA(Sec) selenium transferase [Deltaproteobacteria bacterium]